MKLCLRSVVPNVPNASPSLALREAIEISNRAARRARKIRRPS
jgi:hypothetical protein